MFIHPSIYQTIQAFIYLLLKGGTNCCSIWFLPCFTYFYSKISSRTDFITRSSRLSARLKSQWRRRWEQSAIFYYHLTLSKKRNKRRLPQEWWVFCAAIASPSPPHCFYESEVTFKLSSSWEEAHTFMRKMWLHNYANIFSGDCNIQQLSPLGCTTFPLFLG